jgi:hypothetical protein
LPPMPQTKPMTTEGTNIETVARQNQCMPPAYRPKPQDGTPARITPLMTWLPGPAGRCR